MTRTFKRWARKTRLTDVVLVGATREMEQGLIDADLGGHVVKKRVALPGRGKSGGVRTLVGTNYKDRWFFLFGFEKNERANIDNRELRMLQETAKELLDLNNLQIDCAILAGELLEIYHDKDQT